MLQIGEFSKICQVSVKTLHHYDKIGLLEPAEVDRLTGYRFYQPEQIDTMNYIQRLKRYGFSLEELKLKQQEMAIIITDTGSFQTTDACYTLIDF